MLESWKKQVSINTIGKLRKPIDENLQAKILELYKNGEGLTPSEIGKQLNMSRYRMKYFLNSKGFKGYGLTLDYLNRMTNPF